MVRYMLIYEIYTRDEESWKEPLFSEMTSIRTAKEIMKNKIATESGWNKIPLKLKKTKLAGDGVIMAWKFVPETYSTHLIVLYYDTVCSDTDRMFSDDSLVFGDYSLVYSDTVIDDS